MTRDRTKFDRHFNADRQLALPLGKVLVYEYDYFPSTQGFEYEYECSEMVLEKSSLIFTYTNLSQPFPKTTNSYSNKHPHT